MVKSFFWDVEWIVSLSGFLAFHGANKISEEESHLLIRGGLTILPL
ncbi:hypothetical protein CSE_14750 [Caldisericum exile AZM16c01]|uniref:Uncharacterized protein n=1 Tax=Caldisericum exile (strain DSM 21853 / NBRC 104410 / AZM16c01) TaxID=511051 RepID=A0A7U6GFS6_CALEA|nr:hypothetical protein CSE_14750 [Caldisericum exile AZM16c01]